MNLNLSFVGLPSGAEEAFYKKYAIDLNADSSAVEEEIILDENGNPIIREVPTGESNAQEKKGEETGEKKEKKEKKKAKPSEQVINFDDL